MGGEALVRRQVRVGQAQGQGLPNRYASIVQEIDEVLAS